jgi:hypothetical protein
MKPTLFLTAVLLSLTSCTSIPRSDLRITQETKDISNCKPVGGAGPFSLRDHHLYVADMKARAFEKGDADTFLITRITETQAWGMAYNCKGFDLRQPTPVTDK